MDHPNSEAISNPSTAFVENIKQACQSTRTLEALIPENNHLLHLYNFLHPVALFSLLVVPQWVICFNAIYKSDTMALNGSEASIIVSRCKSVQLSLAGQNAKLQLSCVCICSCIVRW